ncbi:MAG: hypothetical protein EU532_03225 [Promethearchaeota archaeon]|nr:MAG: hypothetical protein EU532_03225 [Candidatus Lokiarchaeota archaeon]
MPPIDYQNKLLMFDYRFTGIIGSILIIISEFLPWFSQFSLFDAYVLYTITAVEEAFLFLFPLISGIICLIASILILKNLEYKINSVIITFIGLGFLTFFLVEFIPGELFYLSKAGIGFYLCIAGFIIMIINIILILISKE